jgi:hypothetical protein
MGGVAWISHKEDKYSLVQSVGGYKRTKGETPSGRRGLLTKGLTACFAIIVIGPKGAILVHVSAYLGHAEPAQLHPTYQAELKAMIDGFDHLWARRGFAADNVRCVFVPGENTDENQMAALISYMFPQIGPCRLKITTSCDKNPLWRTEAHGTAQVMTDPVQEIFVEDRRT